MPKPIDSFTKSMARVQNMMALHAQLHGQPGRPAQVVSDILRSALVLSVGALDGLILEASIAAIPKALNKRLMGDTALKWIKDSPDDILAAMASGAPGPAFAAIARRNLDHHTFQNAQMIQGHLAGLLGATAPWARAAHLLGAGPQPLALTADGVRDKLQAFVLRRHRIAHSGDLTATGSTRGITLPYVRENVQIVMAVGQASCWVIEQRLSAPKPK